MSSYYLYLIAYFLFQGSQEVQKICSERSGRPSKEVLEEDGISSDVSLLQSWISYKPTQSVVSYILHYPISPLLSVVSYILHYLRSPLRV